MKNKLLIISGCHPGVSGLGRVIDYLYKQSCLNGMDVMPCRFIFRSGGLTVGQYFKSRNFLQVLKNVFKIIYSELVFRLGLLSVGEDEEVVLIHPQSLGFDWCINFIENTSRPVWFYLMDSSYFCVRSYNHLNTETSSCLRCIGGDFDNIDHNGCIPFPRNDKSSRIFVKRLIKFVSQNKIKFLVQNDAQKSLVKRHFNEERVVVKTIGLWASDWSLRELVSSDLKCSSFDIVFHGPEFEAKGIRWVIELAKLLPNYSFLFPFKKDKGFDGVYANCCFRVMSWETGLKSFVESSRITIVPSLWSAPIEGALIKSIACAKITAVVENKTAFSNEIPVDVVLKLPEDVVLSASLIEGVFKRCDLGDDVIDKVKRNVFINEFEEKNINLLSRLVTAVNQKAT